MTVARYAFEGVDAISAAGASVRIPAGIHPVERRSLVFRIRLGGREIDLTLGEFDRLLQDGRVRPASEPGAAD